MEHEMEHRESTSQSVNSLKGVIWGSIIGNVKGDAESLDLAHVVLVGPLWVQIARCGPHSMNLHPASILNLA